MSSAPAGHKPSSWFSARIAGLVWKITPDCREVTRLTSQAHDRPLPFTTRTRLSLHRMFCEECARYAAQLDLIREAAQTLPERLDHPEEHSLNAGAKARLKEAIQRELAD